MADPRFKTLVDDLVYELYSPPEHKTTLDIVFFHGLQPGDYKPAYRTTWTMATDENKYWPVELLPKDFPGARILSVSYDSSAFTFGDKGRLKLHQLGATLASAFCSMPNPLGDRPLYLVGHSLGGIMIKQVCVELNRIMQADNEHLRHHCKKILSCLRGTFSFAVPNKGSHLANYLALVPGAGKVVEVLKSDNPELTQLGGDYESIRSIDAEKKRWKTAGVGETKMTRAYGFCKMVVEDESAKYRIDQYCAAPEKDHNNICKCFGTDLPYLNLSRHIRDCCEAPPPDVKIKLLNQLPQQRQEPGRIRHPKYREVANKVANKLLNQQLADGSHAPRLLALTVKDKDTGTAIWEATSLHSEATMFSHMVPVHCCNDAGPMVTVAEQAFRKAVRGILKHNGLSQEAPCVTKALLDIFEYDLREELPHAVVSSLLKPALEKVCESGAIPSGKRITLVFNDQGAMLATPHNASVMLRWLQDLPACVNALIITTGTVPGAHNMGDETTQTPQFLLVENFITNCTDKDRNKLHMLAFLQAMSSFPPGSNVHLADAYLVWCSSATASQGNTHLPQISDFKKCLSQLNAEDSPILTKISDLSCTMNDIVADTILAKCHNVIDPNTVNTGTTLPMFQRVGAAILALCGRNNEDEGTNERRQRMRNALKVNSHHGSFLDTITDASSNSEMLKYDPELCLSDYLDGTIRLCDPRQTELPKLPDVIRIFMNSLNNVDKTHSTVHWQHITSLDNCTNCTEEARQVILQRASGNLRDSHGSVLEELKKALERVPTCVAESGGAHGETMAQ